MEGLIPSSVIAKYFNRKGSKIYISVSLLLFKKIENFVLISTVTYLPGLASSGKSGGFVKMDSKGPAFDTEADYFSCPINNSY